MTTLAERITPDLAPDRSRVRLWLRQHLDYPYSDCCLIWPFGRNKDGYGIVGEDGKTLYAHRVMCRLVHGEPPMPTHHASHSCNRGHDGCINPHHLDWKTPGANHREGEWHPKIKINAGQAKEIRDLKGLEVVSDTAERYGLSVITVRQIQAGRIWRTDCRRGTNHFTDEQIQFIRSLKGSGRTKALAEEFGVSYNVIYKIMQRQTWQHVF